MILCTVNIKGYKTTYALLLIPFLFEGEEMVSGVRKRLRGSPVQPKEQKHGSPVQPKADTFQEWGVNYEAECGRPHSAS